MGARQNQRSGCPLLGPAKLVAGLLEQGLRPGVDQNVHAERASPLCMCSCGHQSCASRGRRRRSPSCCACPTRPTRWSEGASSLQAPQPLTVIPEPALLGAAAHPHTRDPASQEDSCLAASKMVPESGMSSRKYLTISLQTFCRGFEEGMVHVQTMLCRGRRRQRWRLECSFGGKAWPEQVACMANITPFQLSLFLQRVTARHEDMAA